jgi:hypothetical protein
VAKVTGVERDPGEQGLRGPAGETQIQNASDVANELARAARLTAHVHEVTEQGVVVVMVDVDDKAAPRRERQRQPLQAAAVERVQGQAGGR